MPCGMSVVALEQSGIGPVAIGPARLPASGEKGVTRHNKDNKALRLPSVIKTCFNNSPRIAPLGWTRLLEKTVALVGPSLWEVCYGMHMDKRNRCPRCQSQSTHRSRRQGVLERLFCAVFFVIPFRCEVCDKRYFRSRFPIKSQRATA